MPKVTDQDLISRLNQAQESSSAAPQGQQVRNPVLVSDLEQDTTSQQSWYEDPLNASRAVLDGMWFGWSDELGASVAAGMVKLLGGAGSEKPYNEIRREMVGSLEQERQAYAEQNPAASLALNVAGGIVSPLNRIVPGGVGIAAAKGPLRQLLSSSPAARAITVGTTEGAVAGAGYAESGAKVAGAESGAAFGFAIPALFAGGRGILNQASQRRIEQALDTEDGFMPINLAANPDIPSEGLLRTMYRDVVGKAIGSTSLMRQQADRFIKPLQDTIAHTESTLAQKVGAAKRAVNEVKLRFKGETEDLLEEARRQSEDLTAGIRGTKKAAKAEFDQQREAAKATTIASLDNTVNDLERSFRSTALNNSIPSGVSAQARREIMQAPNLNAAVLALDNQWSQKGFSMLEGRSFRINPQVVAARIDQELGASNRIAAGLLGQAPVKAGDFVKEFLDEFVRKGGWIEGADLSALRSRLGTLASGVANNGQGAGVVAQNTLKRLQEILNDTIESQLGGKALEQFRQHREAYQYASILREAVTQASKEGGRRGAFTADDWLSASVRARPELGRRGSLNLQNSANEVAELTAQRDTVLQQQADAAIQQAKRNMTRNIQSTEEALLAEQRRLRAENRQIRRKQELRREDQLTLARNEDEIANLESRIDSLKATETSFLAAAPKKDAPPWEKLFATSVLSLGGVFAGPVGFAMAPVVANVLARPTTQRIVAGQTAAQARLQQLLQATQNYGNNVAFRGTARGLVGQAESGRALSEEDRTMILSSSDTFKARMYDSYNSKDRLEQLRLNDPEVYQELQRAKQARP